MHTRSYLLSALLIGSALPHLLPAQAITLNVESFGAVADGSTDNTAAINRALAALHSSQVLYFPCTQGGPYLIRSPLHFASLRGEQLLGASSSCEIEYAGSGSQPYAFSFVGALNAEIRNLYFGTSGNNPPSVAVMLGRPTSSSLSGILKFNNVRVEGYATKALVYSIASEQNTWLEPAISLHGGGALYGFYTSGSDDLGVDNLADGSNLSLWMQNFNFIDTSPTGPNHALIFDAGDSSGSGNHTFRDGYLSSLNGTAFEIYSKAGYRNWMTLTIDSNRFEDGYQMFNFAGGGNFGDISITNNKADSGGPYFIYLPGDCRDCKFENNTIGQGNPAISLFSSLSDSAVSENYAFTVGQSVNSYIENRQTGTLQIGSTSSSVACSAANEGALQYLKGNGGSDGVFRICQLRSGSYNWVTH